MVHFVDANLKFSLLLLKFNLGASIAYSLSCWYAYLKVNYHIITFTDSLSMHDFGYLSGFHFILFALGKHSSSISHLSALC